MLLHDEIIIFSRASLLNKIKNGIFSTRKLRRKYAFSGICKNTCNFSKDYLSWVWKIRKYSKIIVYLYKSTQSLELTSTFYSKGAVWYWKSKIRLSRRFFIAHVWRRSFAEDFSLYYFAWVWTWRSYNWCNCNTQTQ